MGEFKDVNYIIPFAPNERLSQLCAKVSIITNMCKMILMNGEYKKCSIDMDRTVAWNIGQFGYSYGVINIRVIYIFLSLYGIINR